ncbi:MAG: hypothetical protein ABSF34_21920 [Verrucomicrobiota bacterium]|jgi:hypothetical protein
MRSTLLFSAFLICAGQNLAFAQPLVCPVSTAATANISSKEVASLVAIENPVDRAAMLSHIVAKLRDGGMVSSGIVENLVSAYCPLVAANKSWSDQQKKANVRSFASEAVRAAYAFEDASEIILDVALPPDVVNIINKKALQDHVTVQDWAATAVRNAAKAP